MARIVNTTMLVAVLLAAACGSIVPEGPPAWRDGYDAGCTSGMKAKGFVYAPFTKNVPRYGYDPLYRQGWDDGFMSCR